MGSHRIETIDATAGVERNALAWNDRATVCWFADGALNTVRFGSGGAVATTRPAPLFGSEVESVDVTADGSRAVLVTATELIEIDADGTLRWRFEFPPHDAADHALAAVRYGRSGDDIWLYRPDTVSGRSDRDVLFLVDARKGVVLASERLATTGYGAEPYRHPGGRVLVEIPEGQVGVRVVEAWRDGDRVETRDLGWSDRCLMGVSPDGGSLYTVGIAAEDAIVHRYPGGDAVVVMDAVGLATAAGVDVPDGGVHIGLGGGFLDDRTLLIRLLDAEDERDDLPVTLVVDVTGVVHGVLPGDVRPLGDGTWIARDPGGALVRRGRR